MIRLLIVHRVDSGEVLEQVTLQRGAYASVDAFMAAVRQESAALWDAHGLPRNELRLHEAAAPSVDDFYAMNPAFKRTPATRQRAV